MKRPLLVIMAAVVALAAVMIPLSLRQSSWNKGYSALTISFLQNQEKTSSTLSESSAVDGTRIPSGRRTEF